MWHVAGHTQHTPSLDGCLYSDGDVAGGHGSEPKLVQNVPLHMHPRVRSDHRLALLHN